MFVGPKENPIAVGKKSDMLANLDEEFESLLDDAYDHLAGFRVISSDDKELSTAYIKATRYLVLELMKEYGKVGQF